MSDRPRITDLRARCYAWRTTSRVLTAVAYRRQPGYTALGPTLNGLPVDVYVAERGGWQQLTLVDCRILVLRSILRS